MSDNRFEFLEIGDAELRPAPEPAPAPPPPRAPAAPDGTALSQVRVSDPRGYQAFLDQQESAEAITAAGRRARGGPPGEPRLRLAEVIGGQGVGAGQFNGPTGLALDADGVLFVADSYNHRIQRITPDGGVSPIGGRGGGRGQFLSPQGMATDARRAFYIVEQGNHRVQKYSATGVLQLIFGRPGRGRGEMHGPMGIAVAPGTGDIYVADTGNRRVQRFDCEGNFLSVLGASGGLYAPLVSPQALAVDARDNLFVADTFAHRVVQYDPLGRPVTQFHPAGLQGPCALACDAAGLLYVGDSAPPEAGDMRPTAGRVHALGVETGATKNVVTSLNGSGPLLRPGGLAVTKPAGMRSGDGAPAELYVADTMNHRVLRFVWN